MPTDKTEKTTAHKKPAAEAKAEPVKKAKAPGEAKAEPARKAKAPAGAKAAAEKTPKAVKAKKTESAPDTAAESPVEVPVEAAPVEAAPVDEISLPADDTPRRSVAFIGSECYPFVKTGGLGDVMYALPKALVKHNCDVKVILPRYRCIPWEYQQKMHR